MKTFTIGVIAGDGVGAEVIPQTKRVLESVAQKHETTFAFQDFDWGADHFFRWGRMMPAGAIDLLQPCDAILLGAVAHPDIPDRTFRDVAAEFPDVETESLLVDAAAMNFIRRPESFDVVVGSNLFADILSDISAIIIGSMGLAASANLDPLRRFPSMFEPVHGSAPDIAGKGIVNPLATILSAGMMLDHLEMRDAARQIEHAVAAVLAEGKVRTPDLGGKSS